MRIIVAGGGKMGEAFTAGLLHSETVRPEHLLVVEVEAGRRGYIESTFPGVGVSWGLPERDSAAGFDLLLIAVKPTDLDRLLEEVVSRIPPTVVVLSIAAGVRIASLRRRLGPGYKVIRAMPNLGATLGAGVSAYSVGEDVSDEEKSLARRVLEAVGPAIEVAEKKLNAVTALSGSGPAYAFLLAEAMENAAIALGLSREEAEVLIPHTILAAGLLLVERGPRSKDGLSAKEWREAVTSKGGTTEAALEVLSQRKFVEVVKEAIEAAARRASELDILAASHRRQS